MNRSPIKKQLSAGLAVLFFAWLGFLACVQHFALTLPQKPPLAASLTDGLVVATGGQSRIIEGLRLIEQGASMRMLITGVGKGISKTSLTETFATSARQRAIFDCCVDLDATAIDTKGNAIAARNLVTGSYRLSLIHISEPTRPY